MLGKAKAILNIGHFAMEELATKYSANCIKEFVGDELEVSYIPLGAIYRYDV